jgi:thiol-disulfide isomerase/thioredoxin
MKRRQLLAAAPALLPLMAPSLARAADAPLPKPWPAGQATPQLSLPSWQGEPRGLASLRGRPVLLNFWASWCPPCVVEMPSLELLATRFEAEGLEVLAINYRETDAAVRRFVEQTSLSLPVLRDRDGGAAKAFGVRIFPSSIAIGRDGRARFSVTGEVDWMGADAHRWLAPVLATR